jgi:hypothetical protein
VPGPQPDFTGNGSYYYILTNSDNVARSVTWIFTPRITDIDGHVCNNGISDTVVVWVNPTPDILVTATDTLICNEELAQFKVDNLNPYVRGEWRYRLDVEDASGMIDGERADGDYPMDSILIEDQLINNDTVAHRITYHFTPYIDPSDGEADCGTDRDTLITIWVNPTPRILVDFPDTIFCNNDTAVISVLDGLGFVQALSEYTVIAIYDDAALDVISRASGAEETWISGTPLTDIYVNHSLETQELRYYFTPRIRDTRPGHEGEFCPDGEIEVRIWIHPDPDLNVSVADSILCDGTQVDISITSSQGTLEGGTLLYDLSVSYDGASVSGTITADGSFVPDQTINDLLINDTDTVQLITYHFRARIRDDRPGHEGTFCDNGADTTISIYLNPTPRFNYLLSADTLCHTGGFDLQTDTFTYATHPHYYGLTVTSYSPDLQNVASSGDRPARSPLNQLDLVNTGDSVATVTYEIQPYIWGEGCPGADTTITIRVNPEPRVLIQEALVPWAVCHDSGYVIPMSTPVLNTTGDLRYNLYTDGYNVANVDNVLGDGDYVIADMDQSTVLNHGEIIENVTYHFLPVIRNTGPAGFCAGSPPDSIMVQVAPELRGNLVPDTSYVGGHIIRCHGETNTMLHPNVRGGYYLDPYFFNWQTEGGNTVSTTDSTQTGLGIRYGETDAEYWFEVKDIIGCYFSDTILLTQPDTFEVNPYPTIIDATCAATYEDDGSIDIDPTGGVLGYEFHWMGPFESEYFVEDIVAGVAGRYTLNMTDVNECFYEADYVIDAAAAINVSSSLRQYGNYQITCDGDSTGEIHVQDIAGGFPGYRLTVVDVFSGDTVFNQPVTRTGEIDSITVRGLPAGEYELIAYDQVECRNDFWPGIFYSLEDPEPISIARDTAQFYHDTVDVSCFEADDGFINLVVSGGHTEDYANDYIWTGTPDPHLIQGDSIQDSLSGGTYIVQVVDNFGCTDSAEFTLFEPSPILLNLDSISDFNGWNISCFAFDDGFLATSSSGGVSPHGYAWNTSAISLPDPTAEDIFDLVAGSYDLIITDSIGCFIDTSFDLIEPNPLGLNDSIPRRNDWEIFCAGDSSGQIFLTPLGGADSLNNAFTWNTDIGYLADPSSMNQANLPVGNYWVTVTDINGCDTTFSYLLQEPDPIVIDTLMVDSAVCHGSATGAINMEMHGGQPAYIFNWSNNEIPGFGESTEDISNLLAGVYIIEIIDDNGCFLIDSAEVFEADRFGVDLLVVSDYNGAVISCSGYDDGAIAVDTTTLGGTQPYSYMWNTRATTYDLVGVPEGTYKVVVIDGYLCVDSAEVTIEDPLPIEYAIQVQDPLCYGDSTGQIDLLLSGGTVNGVDDYRVWMNEELTGPFARDLSSGVYQFQIHDLNDCDTVGETELIDPPLLVLSFDTENAFCTDKPDGQMNLYIDGGVGGYW